MLDFDVKQQLLDAVRRFAREKLVPAEQCVAEENKIDGTIIDQMKELGLFGLSLPQAFGGLELSMREEAEVIFELAWAAPAFRSVVGTNIGIGSQAIVIGGTEAQKSKYLPRLAAGDLIGSFALTEPEAGSDVKSIKTRAVREGGDFVLNGSKRYITNGPTAGLFTVFAKTENAEGELGISAFLVDGDTKGLARGKSEKKMGQQGAHVCDIYFEDCKIGEECLLGGVLNQGLNALHQVLMRGRLHIAAVSVGLAQRIIHEAITYANERRQFGEKIGNFQLIQAMLADSHAELYAARTMVLDCAERFDRGEDISVLGPSCKLFASEMVGRVADRAVQIFGGAGYMAEYAVEQFYRDARLFRIYEGTSEIQRLIIGRKLVRDGFTLNA